MLVLGYTLLELVDMVEAIRTGWRREFLGYSVAGGTSRGPWSHPDAALHIFFYG